LTNTTIARILFLLLAAACLLPFMSPPIALGIGIVFAIFVGNPYPKQTSKIQKILLQTCVVLFGFGMDLDAVIRAGETGFVFTVATIAGTLVLGYIVGKSMGIEKGIRHLISSGTAICGGSAIAAVGSAMKADANQMSVSLATVFVLNAIALFLFPILGEMLTMTQEQFGMWCAIAIHDTSSVVGAASRYGMTAEGVAITVKLARALWIIPVALATAFAFRTKGTKISIPWFIFLFILASVARHLILQSPAAFLGILYIPDIIMAARIGLTLTLFLIGAGLSKAALKSVGAKPLVFGMILWAVISVVSLVVVLGTV
jgi:uncharacterized integral membrane protein (TIGR00698 family)